MNEAKLLECWSPKQLEVIKAYYRKNPYMIINDGAVRTGKTTVDNFLFLNELRRIQRYANGIIKYPQYILGGASVKKINQNVIRELNNNYGLTIKLNKYNEFELFDCIVVCTGTDDIGQFSNIVGMTAYGAYINEASVSRQEVFDEILKRCSGDYNVKTGEGFAPKIIIDTNPDSPVHFIKQSYIDKADGKTIYRTQWGLDDNPFLNPQVKRNIKDTTPSGVFYDRKILGLWSSADGVVYADFDKNIHFVEQLPKVAFTRYIVGVDWGYEHKGVMVLFGVTEDKTLYLIEEIVAQHKLIDWWIEQARKIIKDYGYGIPFYCDTARPDLIAEFQNNNIWTVDAIKDINAGVEKVAERIHNKKFFALKDKTPNFEKEVYSYVWDKKTGKPVKENDDVMDAVRYAIYTDSQHHNY